MSIHSKQTKRVAAAVAASLALAFAGPASAAVDYFLKIDGVPGESTDDKHKDWIEVLSWSWGVSRISTSAAANRTSSKPCVADMNFVKPLDKATPLLLADAATGMFLPSATLVARKAGEKPLEYLKIELKDVLVSSYQSGGGGGSSLPVDQFSLNFSKMTVEYKEQKADGSPGAIVQASFQGGC